MNTSKIVLKILGVYFTQNVMRVRNIVCVCHPFQADLFYFVSKPDGGKGWIARSNSKKDTSIL